jgi:predicted RNA-binding protein associated with RNAse of E/G family
MEGDDWSTTDLCLDVWSGADGAIVLLDEDDFEEAVRESWMDAVTAGKARKEAEELLKGAKTVRWPPREVREWTLERAQQEVGGL